MVFILLFSSVLFLSICCCYLVDKCCKLKIILAEKSTKLELLQSSQIEFESKIGKIFKESSVEVLDKLMEEKEKSMSKVLDPLRETIGNVDKSLKSVEKEQHGNALILQNHISMLSAAKKDLQKETAGLVRSLKKPEVRGFWGEMQLKRIVELAGMMEQSDFVNQKSEKLENGMLRPDLLIKLPGNKKLIVDSKAPLYHFLEANSEENVDCQEEYFKKHADILKKHIKQLGSKKYWECFKPNPEFVVLFLPSEGILSHALLYDSTLIEVGIQNNVVVATPNVLIAMLRSIAYLWKEEVICKNIEQINKLSYAIYKQIIATKKNFSTVGGKLKSTLDSYNKTMQNVEKIIDTGKELENLVHVGMESSL